MKRFISLVLCFMLVFTLFQPAFAEDNIITWTGNAGDESWHTAGNWTPERVPDSGDTAVIPESQTVIVTADTTAALDCSGEVLVEAGAHLTLTGTSYLRGGMLGGDGNITITDNGSKLHWSNGNIEGEGTFTIDPDTQLVIETDFDEDFEIYIDVRIERPLVNNGQIMVNRGEFCLVGGSGGTGTFIISEGAYLVFEEVVYNIGGDFVNKGFVYIWNASVHFDAGYRQESTGHTVLDFLGAEPDNYCKLDVVELAELDGTLEIATWEYLPGDFPSPGDTFDIMTYDSRTGQFSEIISYPVEVNFDPNYGDTRLTLTVKEDNTPPHLTSTTPAHGAAIPSDTDIDSLTLVFDEPVWGWSSDTEENLLSIYEAGTDNLVFEQELSPYDDWNKISGNGQDTFTISIPSGTFQLGKSYYILIDEGAFVDVAGNEFAGISDSNSWAVTVQGDTQPPTVPANLHSTSSTSSSVILQWDLSSDDYGPISYDIYGKKTSDEEFVLIGTTTDTTYTVVKLGGSLPEYISPETTYTFVVCAVDGSGYASAQSNEVTVTTNQSPNLNWVKRSIESFTPGEGFPFEWIFYYDTCYGTGKYVAVGTYGTILTSVGIESPWKFEYGANLSDPSLKAITYGNDILVAVGGNSVYTKTSTGEWNKVFPGYGSAVFEDVACGKKKDGSGDIFVAVGKNMIWWSENGIDWQQCLSKPYMSTDFVFCGVTADEEGNFVAVGYRERPYGGNNSPLIWKSDNGKNWSFALDSSGNGQLTGLAYGSGTFVTGGGSVPEALISTNKGSSWGKSSVLSGGLTKIAYGDGLFVATGGTKIYISDNGGYTWTRSGEEFEKILVSINYCNESFVVTDSDGDIFQTVRESGGPAITPPSEPQDFTATPGNGQVALSWKEPASNGGSDITHYEVSSDNGSTWVTASTGTSHTFTGLANGTEYTFKARAVNSAGPGTQASITATPAAPGFAGGSGTKEDPYLVANAEQLNNVRNHLDKHFLLIDDINLCGYNSGEGWEPIGSKTNNFTGSFNGDGHTISNLYIYLEGQWNVRIPVGLFRYTGKEAEILNLTLENTNVTGCYYVGGLVGYNSGNITNVHVNGNITGEWDTGGLTGLNNGSITNSAFTGCVTGTDTTAEYGEWTGGLVGYNLGTVNGCWANATVVSEDNSIGGLVGENYEGIITESYSSGTVTGWDYVGGLAGNNSDGGVIAACYSTCTVNGNQEVGGLVGASSGEITACYSTGAIDGEWEVGGLVGLNYGTIATSFAVGEVKGTNRTGGLVGKNSETTGTDCYWNTQTSGQITSACGKGRTTAKMKEQATYEGWDFDGVWDINGINNNGYPFLRWQKFDVVPTAPGEPQNFTATPGDSQVTLIWTIPESDGGAEITHYEVSSDNGSTWVTASSSTSHTFTSLTNGTEYTFKVRAVNSAGPGAAASTTATPIAPPIPTYTVTVTNGTGGGEYPQGATVVITANPAPDGQRFKEWQVISGSITLQNPMEASTSFQMPANAVEVAANYEAIPVTTYTVTVNGSYAATTGAGSYAQGETVTINAGSRTNYSFSGWTSSEDVTFENLNSPTTTFIMPARNVTITANWTYIDGEGGEKGSEDGEESGESDDKDGEDDPSGDGGDSTPSTPGTSEPPAYIADVKTEKGTEMVVPVTVDTDTGIASVNMDSDRLAQGGVNITIPSIPDINAYSVNIPVQDLSAIDVQDTFSFHTETGSITIPSNMLAGILASDGDQAQIMIGQGDKSNLPDDIRDTIGDRPLVQLTLSIDGKQTEWNNPDAPVTVSIPYTPTADELANPESIVVWYIDGSGNVVSVPNGRYDPVTGSVTFTTTHFSYYAVSYKQVSFKDVAKNVWYSRAVSFIAAREITLGTGNGNFSPGAKLTRGQFIVMMMRAYGIAPDEDPKDNFKDAGNTWYTGYLAAAKRLGISAGVGNNLFAPENAITRQEMFTLLYNVLKVIGKLPQGHSGKTLTDFSDAGDIAPWAMDAMKLLVETGMVSGSGNKLSPKDTTTRAQMAQVLYNLLSK